MPVAINGYLYDIPWYDTVCTAIRSGLYQLHGQLLVTKLFGRGSRPEHPNAEYGDTRNPRVQTRNNADAGAQMDGTAIPRIPRLILPRNIAEFAAESTRVQTILEARPNSLVNWE